MVRKVVVTPVLPGSSSALDRLATNLANQEYDEWRLWLCCTGEDAEHARRVASRYGARLEEPEGSAPHSGALNVHRFYAGCVDHNTHYLRIDTDVAWLAPDFTHAMFAARAAWADAFLVHANLVGSPLLAHVHQRVGAVDHPEAARAHVDCPVANSADYCAAAHAALRADPTPARWTFPRWVLQELEPMHLKAFAWRGEEFSYFDGRVPMEDAPWLNVDRPRTIGRRACVCGEALGAVASDPDLLSTFYERNGTADKSETPGPAVSSNGLVLRETLEPEKVVAKPGLADLLGEPWASQLVSPPADTPAVPVPESEPSTPEGAGVAPTPPPAAPVKKPRAPRKPRAAPVTAAAPEPPAASSS